MARLSLALLCAVAMTPYLPSRQLQAGRGPNCFVVLLISDQRIDLTRLGECRVLHCCLLHNSTQKSPPVSSKYPVSIQLVNREKHTSRQAAKRPKLASSWALSVGVGLGAGPSRPWALARSAGRAAGWGLGEGVFVGIVRVGNRVDSS